MSARDSERGRFAALEDLAPALLDAALRREAIEVFPVAMETISLSIATDIVTAGACARAIGSAAWSCPAGLDLDVVAVPAHVKQVFVWAPAGDAALDAAMARLVADGREVVRMVPPAPHRSWLDVVGEGGDYAVSAAAGAAKAWRPGEHTGPRIITAEQLLAESDDPLEYLCDRLLAPGCVTILCSPRGTGKSHCAHGIATALATGVRRIGTSGERMRVLLVDRDNPRQTTRERLRRWRREGAPLDDLHYVGRNDDVASLLDGKWWSALPVGDYAAVILDSLGSLLPGVQDKDTAAYGRAIATAIGIAERGPAVCLLANPIKDASAIRGSGVSSDRVEAVYELRDVTGWQPAAKGEHWFSALPEAGEAAFVSRAARRKGETTFRLAFLVSKFRAGVEPSPFCVELRLPRDGGWELTEVTYELEAAHEAARGAAKQDAQDHWRAAREGLAGLVKTRSDAGDPLPVAGKLGAETWLKDAHGLGRNEARRMISAGAEGDNAQWRRSGAGTRKAPHCLLPIADSLLTPDSKRRETDPPEPLAAQGETQVDSRRSTAPRPARNEVAQTLVREGANGGAILATCDPDRDREHLPEAVDV